MKSCFVAVALAFVSSAVLAGDASAPQSVLAQPTPAIVADAAPACVNGSCRAGLFGRTIEKTRTVTRAAVEVPAQVVAAPVRAARACRSCRGGRCCR